MTVVRLPRADRSFELYTLRDPQDLPRKAEGPFNRLAFSAAHVVHDPLCQQDPWLDQAIDWDATLAYRRYLWGLGLAVAEAMDTAQRGMGLDWDHALELITRSVAEARTVPGAIVFSGAGTDHVAPPKARSVEDVIRAYEEQVAAIEKVGGRIILMASRALAANARGPDDYATVYGRILGQVREPVIIHWLGEMFDPALEGYWGSKDHWQAMGTCLSILQANSSKVDGIKISLLSKEKEIEMRRRLPAGVRMYTGDDFNYAELIGGDEQGYSDALLGIFDAIAPAASAALSALARGDKARFEALLEPTVPLSRHIFRAPTRFYKTGVVFMAWLNGHQDGFTMLGGQESARSLLHLAELVRLADQAGLIRDPERAASRFGHLLAVQGCA
jgi:hypothetical protein